MAATTDLQKTALHSVHRSLNAEMVDFGGWEMPVEYSGLIAEHQAVRTGVGLFDVSHMGEIQLRGPASLSALQQLTMNDVSKLQVGQAQYSALLTQAGTFVDDILIHKFSPNDYMLVVNAANREKDLKWIRSQVGAHHGIHLSDYSEYYTQLAIQGPRAFETVAKLTTYDIRKIKNYWFDWGMFCGVPNTLIARTGYTGEDGFEIYLPSEVGTSERVWNDILKAGGEFGILPCGLGARNTLRLEAAMSLYGHEITEETNVWEAGLDRFCKLEKGPFLGAEALKKIKTEGGPKRKLVGLEITERGIARDGYSVHDLTGQEIGYITSGSPAPFLKKNIALAYLPTELSSVATEVQVQIRSSMVRAKVVSLPFYRRPKTQS